MQPSIEITFQRRIRDRSLESAIQRWVTRIETIGTPIMRVAIAVESAARSATRVSLLVVLGDGSTPTTSDTHDDAYVAVSNAFREARRQLLAHSWSPAIAGMAQRLRRDGAG